MCSALGFSLSLQLCQRAPHSCEHCPFVMSRPEIRANLAKQIPDSTLKPVLSHVHNKEHSSGRDVAFYFSFGNEVINHKPNGLCTVQSDEQIDGTSFDTKEQIRQEQ